MPTKNLINFLAAPARVASKLDWKKGASVLAVDIGRDRIGLAVAPHPSVQDPQVQPLRPLRLEHVTDQDSNRRVLAEDCVQQMASIVKQHDVCALLVSWPVQHEGRCGKPCGQVLHTLDSLLEESNTIVTKNRPVCLWDDRHVNLPKSDKWNRDPLFGKCTATKSKTVHRASQEQYQHHDCSSTVAAQVWQDFCQTHWPEIDVPDVEQDYLDDDNDMLEEPQEAAATMKSAAEKPKMDVAFTSNVNDTRIHRNDDDEEEEEYELKLAVM